MEKECLICGELVLDYDVCNKCVDASETELIVDIAYSQDLRPTMLEDK